jgi:hypothetical protein
LGTAQGRQLPVAIGSLHLITIYENQTAYTCACQKFGRISAYSSQTYYQHTGTLKFFKGLISD